MILTSLIACKIYYLRRGCVDKTISLSISEIVKKITDIVAVKDF